MLFRVPGMGGRKPNGEDKAAAVPIRGLHGNMPVRFAPDGGAVPGDRIVGILTKGEGITIYPIHAQALRDFEEEPDRWLDVRWDMDALDQERFPARVGVTALNEPGSLADIARLIGDAEANISNLKIVKSAPDFSEMVIDVEVRDLKHLNQLIAGVRRLRVVSSANRLNG
jgi:(p)ppGpp synthase/HD superfamily hydrolase